MKGARMQSNAISLEHELSSIYDCDRFSMGGFINSDHIRSKGFIPAIIMILSNYYTTHENRTLIDEYINDILYFSGTRMDDLDESEVDHILDGFEKLKGRIHS